jgi:hypothetical protein
MKKTIFALLLIDIAMLGFAPRVFAQTTVIKDLAGTVELKLSGAADFIPASVGVEVAQNTIISTGFKSTAILQAGSAVILVQPLTRLTLTEIQASQETENLNLSLQSGRVRIDLNPPAGSKASLKIASPSAVASVRGTSFEFDTRNLRVHSGTVVFMGKWGYQVTVQEGRTSVVTASGTAAPPQVTVGGGGSAASQGVGSVAQSGFGYDSTAGTTGGTGVVSNPPVTPPVTPPVDPPPVTPPTTNPPGGGGGGGSGGGGGGSGGGGSGGGGGGSGGGSGGGGGGSGGGSGNSGGTVDIPVSY